MRSIWLLLSLIPGASAIALGRLLGGALLLVVGAAAWNLALYARFFLEVEDLGPLEGLGVANVELASFSVGVASILISIVWTWRLTSRKRRERKRHATDGALTAAHDAYLKGKLEDALGAVGGGLKHDAHDIDLLFLDWQLSTEAGYRRRARRARRRLRRADLDEKWIWELEREEAVGGRGQA